MAKFILRVSVLGENDELLGSTETNDNAENLVIDINKNGVMTKIEYQFQDLDVESDKYNIKLKAGDTVTVNPLSENGVHILFNT